METGTLGLWGLWGVSVMAGLRLEWIMAFFLIEQNDGPNLLVSLVEMASSSLSLLPFHCAAHRVSVGEPSTSCFLKARLVLLTSPRGPWATGAVAVG